MKTEGRRQSKNVKVMPPDNTGKMNRAMNIMKKDKVAMDNSKLKDKTPIANQKNESLISTIDAPNPADNNASATGRKSNPNMRTLKESHPVQKIEHIKMKPYKAKDTWSTN